MIDRCRERGINPGHRIGSRMLLVAITEQRTRADIDLLVETVEQTLVASAERATA